MTSLPGAGGGHTEAERTGQGTWPWSECARLGRHFFTRDYYLGLIPYGRPYCMWCGLERKR